MPKRRGFTLIELISTIAIVGIIAGVAAPLFGDFIENSKLRGAAEHVYSDVQLARSEAIKQNSTFHLSVNTGTTNTNWCYGFSKAINCDCSTKACDKNTKKINGVDLSTDSTIVAGIYLSPNGAVYDSNDVPANSKITLTSNGSKSVSIKINRLGHTSICSSTVPGYSSC